MKQGSAMVQRMVARPSSGQATSRLWMGCVGGLAGLAPALTAATQIVARHPLRTSESRDAMPPYSLRHEASGWWLVSPGTERFFSLGIGCANQGTTRAAFDPENPSFAAWQHYPTTAAWAEIMNSRLPAWGFTTLGGWSDFSALGKSHPLIAPLATNATTNATPVHRPFHLTPVLHLGAAAGAPWWDMWEAQNLARIDATARDQIQQYRDDPGLIGYYSDNELGWWNAALWKTTLEQPSSSGQRRRLIQLLGEIYGHDWSRLIADFEPENAASWTQLQRHGVLYLRPGSAGIHTMRRFLGLLADRYYGLMHDLIRKYDRRALFLGDRYQSFYYPEVVEASARHVDVSSSNLNAQFADGTFLRSYLATLHALANRPIIVSEFYLAAKENRSGNLNSSSGFPVVTTQVERTAAAQRTLSGLARLPFVVGADWFQYSDEPTHGRDDGENYNFGLVDVSDRPYTELTAMFSAFDAQAERATALPIRPDATGGLPPAPADPFSDFRPPEALRRWDRERGFFPPTTPFATADLYAAWSPKGIYLGLYSLDIVESAYYRGPWVPKLDRALLTVRCDGHEITSVRLGAGREPLASEPRVRVENSSGLGNNVANVAALEIPAELWGRGPLHAGETLKLDVTLLTHGRAYRIDWRGEFTFRE